MEAKKMFFMDCHLAGRKYHDADEVWDELKVGTTLRLERDKENRFDPYAVMVVYEKENEDYLLGYIPRGENETVSNLLPIFSKWDGPIYLSAVSARLIQKFIQKSRFIWLLKLRRIRTKNKERVES